MANFVLLYSGGSMPETEAEQAAVMQAWGAWFGQLGSALVDGGNPFTPQAKHIASNGKVSDGGSSRDHGPPGEWERGGDRRGRGQDGRRFRPCRASGEPL